MSGESRALANLELLFCHGVALFSPHRCLLQAQRYVEQILGVVADVCGVRYSNLSLLAGSDGRHVSRALLNDASVAQHLVNEVVALETDERVLVLQCELAVVEISERSVLIYALHLSELARPCAVGRDESVVHKVALEANAHAAGRVVVVARHPVVEAVLALAFALHESCRVVETLVNPVPDAAAEDAVACLDDVPVLLQVAHSLTHCVCILADEVGLACISVAAAAHAAHCRIH